ncbi:MAG: phage holin family protein [Alicyclobacillus herbarius]|uniref:phage holin, LLH family n=1 Tax=Alicyclobacillus herbarius TaxID=122960 RepID=UPI002353B364|nr:phage holin, LLH family [Alicyclobacillus herbarius]MCL6634006.1 phage holin family protein [Alicyclobacillus herbarius]
MVDQVVSAVVNALIGVLSIALSAGAVYAARWLRSHVRSETLGRLFEVGDVIVNAVEQAAAAGLITVPKKDAAVQRLRDWAAQEGVKLSDAQINDIIEAAVKAMKDGGQELKATIAEDPQAKVQAAQQRLQDAQAKAQTAQSEVQAAQAALEQAKKEAAAANGNASA